MGGLDISDARNLKALEIENRRLKKLRAEQMLDNAMLKDINTKKWYRSRPGGKPWLIFVTHMKSASAGRVMFCLLIDQAYVTRAYVQMTLN